MVSSKAGGVLRVAALALLVTAACSAGGNPYGPQEAAWQNPLAKTLFIGNSLTYVNNLPEIVTQISRLNGDNPVLVTAMVAQPNFSLDDHERLSDALQAIDRGGWNTVILQQGPSSLPENRALLVAAAKRFATRIRAQGGEPALYSVWPALQNFSTYDAAVESYRVAAEEVDGIFFPVADAWRAAWRRDEDLPLYDGDGLHPSVYGSYLAGIVIYATLTNQSAVGLPANLGIISVPANAALLMQQAADEAIAAARSN